MIGAGYDGKRVMTAVGSLLGTAALIGGGGGAGAGGATTGGGTGGGGTGSAVSPKTAVPEVCRENSFCWFGEPRTPDADTAAPPLWKPLDCGAVYRFQNGRLFGTGSLCADSPANRKLLHDHNMSGFLPGRCGPPPPRASRCLDLPDGMLFVIWSTSDPPPVCPSTCRDTPAPVDL